MDACVSVCACVSMHARVSVCACVSVHVCGVCVCICDDVFTGLHTYFQVGGGGFGSDCA